MLHRAVIAIIIALSFSAPASASEPYKAVEKLLESSTTVLGQPFDYPKTGKPVVTAVIVTMKPGEKTADHLHEVPLFGYVLEGELTVHYKGHGDKVYKAGTALMEAMDVWHVGENTGKTPMRILAVFMGAEGAKNTVQQKQD